MCARKFSAGNTAHSVTFLKRMNYMFFFFIILRYYYYFFFHNRFVVRARITFSVRRYDDRTGPEKTVSEYRKKTVFFAIYLYGSLQSVYYCVLTEICTATNTRTKRCVRGSCARATSFHVVLSRIRPVTLYKIIYYIFYDFFSGKPVLKTREQQLIASTTGAFS